MVADSEQGLSVRLCARRSLDRPQSHTIFECGSFRRWPHFDDRAVDAVLEQTLSLLTGHHSAAPLHILKEQTFDPILIAVGPLLTNHHHDETGFDAVDGEHI